MQLYLKKKYIYTKLTKINFKNIYLYAIHDKLYISIDTQKTLKQIHGNM